MGDISTVLYPSDESGCGCYRMIWPAQMLKEQGYSVRYCFKHEFQALWQPSPFGDQIVDITDPPDEDVVVFQRPLKRVVVELMLVLQQKYGKAIVVEIDDDFHSLPQGHPVKRTVSPANDRDLNYTWLQMACERADLVICTTEALARRYGGHGRVRIIPNYIPRQWLNFERLAHDELVVGWSGSTHSHVRDLCVQGDAVKRVISHTGAQLRVIGSGDKVSTQLGGSEEPLVAGWVPIEHYPIAYAGLDVAIAPLQHNTFNTAKSWLKPLEAGALGVPCVSSALPEYELLARHGIGLIAHDNDQWYELLYGLLRKKDYREELGQKYRSLVDRYFCMQDHLDEWTNAWRFACELRSYR